MKRISRFTKQSVPAMSTLSLLLSVSTVGADEVEKAVDYRQGVMNVYSWNMKAMSNMMKGKVPYDQKAFAAHANDLAAASALKLMPGFPEDSESEESDALPEIWMEFDDFEAKHRALGEAASNLSRIAAEGEKGAMGEALKKAGKACKACHKKYKN
ncbi:MAG: cytochrome c [Candidatus Thiodiazotropha sp.]